MNQPERINKVLAQLGYGSRRSIDTLITKGRITINGKQARLGQKITPQDTIEVDAKPVQQRPNQLIVIAFHKPKGVVTTRKDRFAKVTVMDYLPPELHHLYPVGRLDKDSRGLLLLTNDGGLAQSLTHPKYNHEKEYEVIVRPIHPIQPATFNQDIERLKRDVIVPTAQTRPFTITHAEFNTSSNQGTVGIILKEGKKRQIRAVLLALGYQVTDLVRTRIMSLTLEGINEGEYVTIEAQQLR